MKKPVIPTLAFDVRTLTLASATMLAAACVSGDGTSLDPPIDQSSNAIVSPTDHGLSDLFCNRPDDSPYSGIPCEELLEELCADGAQGQETTEQWPATGDGTEASGATVNYHYWIGNRSDRCDPPGESEELCNGAGEMDRCNINVGKDFVDTCDEVRMKTWSTNWNVHASVESKIALNVPFCVKGETAVTVGGGRGGSEGDSVTKKYTCKTDFHVEGCDYCGVQFRCDVVPKPGTYSADVFARVEINGPWGSGELDCGKIGDVSGTTMTHQVQPATHGCSPSECGVSQASPLSGECAPEELSSGGF